MIRDIATLECGNDPAELYRSLQMGTTVSVITCKNCGKVLFSVKGEIVSGEYTEVINYFRCICGKKYRKVVMSSQRPQEHLCDRALVQHRVLRTRPGMSGWSDPGYMNISLLDQDDPVYYKVTEEAITRKKGSIYNA